MLRENCKRKANDSISIRRSKIIRSELMATNFEVPHCMNNRKTLFPESIDVSISLIYYSPSNVKCPIGNNDR